MADIVPRGVDNNTGQANNVLSNVGYVKTNGMAVICPINLARVHQSTGQTFTQTPATTTFNFDSELLDNANFHDNVTNNERLTISADLDGKYVEVLARMALTASSTNGAEIFVEHYNSSDALQGIVARASTKSTSDGMALQAYSPPILVSTGDYFVFKGVSYATSNKTTVNQPNNGTTFAIVVKNI